MEDKEAFVPIQDEEELKDLQRKVRDSVDVKAMLETRGWREVMKPGIDRRVGELLNMFRKAKTYEDFISIQQAINAIENILGAANLAIALGDEAAKRIELQNERDRVPDEH
jgi:hypothetical protein